MSVLPIVVLALLLIGCGFWRRYADRGIAPLRGAVGLIVMLLLVTLLLGHH